VPRIIAFYPPITWRRMRTDMKAVAMKVMVAVMDLLEPLEIPQTPWPEVQPLPRTEPKPTRSPAMIRRG